ncbi:unnamed protein product [Vitrella brassicaformis CCMP3155]|uniref:C2 domain-containing protein n=1 Tax=Vitrella brassicaformis (strain CCMP3155) TaxID=1169540 RepID=A0A0G4F2H0_VITBC|nr:unnamed protein product [Vitrella brassicaformis CCMP3155]|eukprot:CEM05829.1 unnamed protein product [Vitrella brassicaformis CCMP3155]
MYLHVDLLQGRNLPAQDEDGNVDPLWEIWVDDKPLDLNEAHEPKWYDLASGDSIRYEDFEKLDFKSQRSRWQHNAKMLACIGFSSECPESIKTTTPEKYDITKQLTGQEEVLQLSMDILGLRGLAPRVFGYELTMEPPSGTRLKTDSDRRLPLEVPNDNSPARNVRHPRHDTKHGMDTVGIRVSSPPFHAPMLKYLQFDKRGTPSRLLPDVKFRLIGLGPFKYEASLSVPLHDYHLLDDEAHDTNETRALASNTNDWGLSRLPVVCERKIDVTVDVYAEKSGGLWYAPDVTVGRLLFSHELFSIKSQVFPYKMQVEQQAQEEENEWQSFNADNQFQDGNEPFQNPILVIKDLEKKGWDHKAYLEMRRMETPRRISTARQG